MPTHNGHVEVRGSVVRSLISGEFGVCCRIRYEESSGIKYWYEANPLPSDEQSTGYWCKCDARCGVYGIAVQSGAPFNVDDWPDPRGVGSISKEEIK